MPFDDEYRELIEDARDAIRKLLDESEHDAWMWLRNGYGDLRNQLDRDDRERAKSDSRYKVATSERLAAERDEYRQRRAVWKGLGREQRERYLLDVLRDERRTIPELTNRLEDHLQGEFGPCAVYIGDVRTVVTRMLHAGQLLPEPETFNKTHTRFRYFRKRGLDGPIADLERAYHDESEKGAAA
jgi:hypothetical protein